MTDAELLRQQYETSLGRRASDEEIAGWTSGKFGGGGIKEWLNQISTSHEAQQRPGYRAPLSQQAAPGAGYNTGSSTTATSSTQPRSSTQTYNRQEPAATAGQGSPWDTFKNETWGSPNYNNNYEDTIRKAYKAWTGREADDAGLQAHLKNPYGLEGALRTIYDSPEAAQYREASAKAAAPVLATTNTSNMAPTVQAQIFKGFTPKYAMEGFDTQREQDTGKSAKDAFAFLSNNAPPPPLNDKAALGAWFQQYVAPGMNQLGHKIISVDGDKFTFENWQGRFTVDFGRGAGAEGGALAWQVEPDTAVMGTGAYVPQAAGTSSGDTSGIWNGGAVNTPAPVTTGGGDNTSSSGGDPVSHTYASPLSSSLRYRRPYVAYDDRPAYTVQPSI